MIEEQWADLAAEIEVEGFDYFFCDYADLDELDDPKLKKLAKAYQKAAQALKDYIDSKLPEETF